MTPEISVVSTLYRSAPHLQEFYGRMKATLARTGLTHEIVMVNDGSPDSSLKAAIEIASSDPSVSVLELSRNFGHHYAALAGIEHSRGEKVFIIDCDLQESPEWLEEFLSLMSKHGSDVVFGVQKSRKTSFGDWGGKAFYAVFNRLARISIPANVCTVRVMTRRYVEALRTLPDRNVFLAGNYAWTGFEQLAVPVTKEPKRTASSYTLRRKLSLTVEAITSFSNLPLHAVFWSSCIVAVFSFAVALLVAILAAFGLTGGSGIQVLILLAILLFGSYLSAAAGLVSLYVGKILIESKQRPRYLIREVHQFPAR